MGFVAAALATPEPRGQSRPALDAVRQLKADAADRGATTGASRRGRGAAARRSAVRALRAKWAEVQQPAPECCRCPPRTGRACACAPGHRTAPTPTSPPRSARLHGHWSRQTRPAAAAFVAELDALRQAFERELTREQQLAAAWKQAARPNSLDDEPPCSTHRPPAEGRRRQQERLRRTLRRRPATASKHLGQLTERGLLVQRGKGPATRYELPPAMTRPRTACRAPRW